MASIIELRRDEAADWTSNDPTLSLGEVGIETDTKSFKIGDGSTAWTSLGYSKLNPTTYTALTSSTIATADCIITYDSSAGDLCYITEANLASFLQTSATTSTLIDSADTILYYDTSASAVLKVTAGNLFISLCTSYSTVTSLESDDMVCAYDTSASTIVKITISNLYSTASLYHYNNDTALTSLEDNDVLNGWDTSASVPMKIVASDLANDLLSKQDITTLTALTALADGDAIPVQDISAGTMNYITYSSLLSLIQTSTFFSGLSNGIKKGTLASDADVTFSFSYFALVFAAWGSAYSVWLVEDNGATYYYQISTSGTYYTTIASSTRQTFTLTSSRNTVTYGVILM